MSPPEPADVPTTCESRQTKPVPATGASTAWISWLRVLAIIAVVTIHSVGNNAVEPDARDTLRGSLAIVLDIGAIFAVPVFVMLSGALLLSPTSYKGPGEFLRKRAWRLVPPLVFWHAWYIVIVQLQRDDNLSTREVIAHVISGNIYTALYFFWIVLGLSVVAPVLIPFLAGATRRQALITGAAAAAIPVLTLATTGLRGAAVVDTAWTWWIPYLGVFILGWALRGVVLRRWALAGTGVVTVALGLLLAWQWRNDQAPDLLQTLSPVSYYGAGVVLYSCGVFLLFQGLIQPDGPLAALTRPAAVKVGRTLGDATLGVFGLHLTIILLVREFPVVGGDPASPGALEMVMRVVLASLITYAIVLVLRRLPLARKVL